MNPRTHAYKRKNCFENKAVGTRQNNVTRPRLVATLMMLVACSLSYGQTLNKNWKEDLTSMLEEFQSCATNESDKAPCSSFITESINVVYPLNSLHLEASAGTVAMLSSHKQNTQWTILGKAYQQDALTRAQDLANDQRAVIAVYQLPGGDVLHMALILPGNLSFSGSWGFSVPNSASFFLATPEKSFVEKGLSYSFAKSMIKDVTLYVRN